MPQRSDEALLEAARHGDRQAFAILVERRQDDVLAFIRRFLGMTGRDAAEDLAQDVFLQVWKAVPRYRAQAKATTWLLRIATNVCLNQRRGARLRRTVPLPAVLEAGGTVADGEGVGLGEETRARVREAVAALPEGQRAVLVLRHFHELPYSEIADVMDTTVSAVESLLFRARTALRKRLAGVETEGGPQDLPGSGAERV